jgi:hypothetical protein
MPGAGCHVGPDKKSDTMQKKLVESTALSPLGETYCHRLLKIPSGTYAGRLVALIQVSASDIQLSFADPPYHSWSSPQTVISDAYNNTFDCRITPEGHIHVVYPETGTAHLVARKLAFSGGQWSVEDKFTVYNGATCFDPCLAVDRQGTLWVSYAQFSSPNRTLCVKSSTDEGATWGTGDTDPGIALVGPSANVWGKLLLTLNTVMLVYTRDLTHLAMRTCPLAGGEWSSEYVIAADGAYSRHFDAAVRPDGLLGVVYESNGLNYREYNDVLWSSEEKLDNAAVLQPTLLFHNNTPVVLYGSVVEGNRYLLKQTTRQSGAFSAPAILDESSSFYNGVALYSATEDSYEDKTIEAGDEANADVYHTDSGCLVRDSQDACYLGMNAPFRFVHAELATAGVGGTISYAYWNGSAWVEFTPVSGMSHLDSALEEIMIWIDYASIPGDWQKRSIQSQSLYWVRLQVVSAFTTGPVGDRLTAIPRFTGFVVRR